MEARRVLHLIDTGGPGGAETIFLDLAEGLPAERWESKCVIPWADDWLHRAAMARGLSTVVVESGGAFDISYLYSLHKLIREFRPHVIQTHLLTTAVYASILGRVWGLPVVSTFHGRVDLLKDERFRCMKLWLMDRPLNRAVMVSQSLLSSFLKSDRFISPWRCRVVRNGVQFDSQPSLQVRAAWRERLGVGRDSVLIGAVGNLRASKDYETLVRAAACALGGDGPDLRFVVAGEGSGPLRQRLVELIDELELGDRVRLLGFVDDVRGLLSGLDIYVLSSSAEGFSLSTVEAMAAGLPVVVTRSGGPEEIVRHGLDGRLVDPRDPLALSEEILRLARSPQERTRLGAEAATSVRRRFSMERMIHGYERIYEEVLGLESPTDAPTA